jgi:LDH2 family malate/lactate/ureidoglycolate dehydrogenase
MTSPCVSVETAEKFIAGVFVSVGVPPADANKVAHWMVLSDLSGADGHGIFRLPAYVKRIREGGMNLHPDIRVEQEFGATALIHGDDGLGHLVMEKAVELAIRKSREHGVCWIGSHHGNHAGAASVYVRAIAEQGLIGIYMAVGNANHMAPWGGIDLLLSTNPLAIAVPAGKDRPIVLLDMASTVAAYGKVKLAAQKGEMMPQGWMMDRQGQPLTDPKRATEGSLLPIGGYKGYGLALMISLLAGSLNDAAVGKDTVDFNERFDLMTNTGQAIIAVNPKAFGDEALFMGRVAQVVEDIKSSTPLPGGAAIRVPGDGSHSTMEKRKKEGIPISAVLLASLNQCAEQTGAPLLRL